MREFKFRAWDNKNKIMTAKVSLSDLSKGFLGLENNVVMQYTGLKDKNGVEIYESDVIVYINDWDKDKNKNIAIIEFSTNNFSIGFNLNPIKETEINFGEDVDGDCCIINFSFYDEMGQNFTWDNLEVIGNIYENPELLKED